MDQLIQNWLDARAEAEAAEVVAQKAWGKVSHAEELAGEVRLPCNTRRATAKDVTEGAILWYSDYSEYWLMVDEVLRPSDEFKAYIAHDGCRYGLDGAFVEVVND